MVKKPTGVIYAVRCRVCSRWARSPSAPLVTQSALLTHFSDFGKGFLIPMPHSRQRLGRGKKKKKKNETCTGFFRDRKGGGEKLIG